MTIVVYMFDEYSFMLLEPIEKVLEHLESAEWRSLGNSELVWKF